jgi:hypothetical protein
MEEVSFLKKLKNKIESLDLCHHKKILEIIVAENIPHSENKNGVFINMSCFNSIIIDKINKYIEYVEKQENTLKQYETMKHSYKKNYFDKQDKEEVLYSN